jgi:hypothetical protein
VNFVGLCSPSVGNIAVALIGPASELYQWPQKSYVKFTLLSPSADIVDAYSQDPNEIKIIYLRATGGEVGASSALAPKIGPLGLVCLPHRCLNVSFLNLCPSSPVP